MRWFFWCRAHVKIESKSKTKTQINFHNIFIVYSNVNIKNETKASKMPNIHHAASRKRMVDFA